MSFRDRNRFPDVFEPDHSHPMIDDFALRAQRQRAAQQPPGVPPVFPLPMRNHPMWSGNNELGQEQEFQLDANNRQTILKMNEWGFPQVWNVKLGMQVRDEDFDANDLTAIYAIVQAGAGGTVQEFEIDWNDGVSFNCAFNALTIIAARGGAANIPPNLRLRASIGTREVSSGLPVRTVPVGVVAAAATSSRFRVPAFARRMWLFNQSAVAGSDVYAANVILNFYTNPTTAVLAYTLPTARFLDFGQGIPLPLAASYFEIVNGSATEIVPSAVFEIGT